MARYIDADKLYKRVKEKTNPYGKPTLDYESGFKVLGMIEQELTADVVEVKHGNWTFARSGRKVVCSCCETPAPFDKKVGYHTLWSSPYCPNCGAKMGGKDINVPTK